MSSATSIENGVPEPDAIGRAADVTPPVDAPVHHGFQPWHFFLLASLVAATAAVVMSRRTSPEHLILISLVIASAGLAAAGFYRMLAPLVPPLRLWRTARLCHNASTRVPFTAWLLLSLLLAAHAAGEAVGYWRVVGDIEHRYEHFELHRLECLRPDERGLMTGT